MNRYEKLAWRLSAIYSICALLSLYVWPASTTELAFQITLLGMFYLGFKRKKIIFSALGFGWLFFGSMKAILHVYTQLPLLSKSDGFTSLLAGAFLMLIFMLTTTYFALRAFVAQIARSGS